MNRIEFENNIPYQVGCNKQREICYQSTHQVSSKRTYDCIIKKFQGDKSYYMTKN